MGRRKVGKGATPAVEAVAEAPPGSGSPPSPPPVPPCTDRDGDGRPCRLEAGHDGHHAGKP